MGKVLIVKGADFSEVALGIETREIKITTDDLIPTPEYYITTQGEISYSYNVKGKSVDVSNYKGKNIKVKKATGKDFSRISFLKSAPVLNSQGDFATGYETEYFLTISTSEWNGVIPNDANYMYIMTYNSNAGGDIFPSEVTVEVDFNS